MQRTYRPSYRMPTSAIVILLLVAIAGGAILGVGAGLVSRVFWLIVLFPILVGLAGGALLARVIKARHVRNPVVGLSSAVLLSLVLYTASHIVSYQYFRSDVKELIAGEDVAFSPEEEDAFINFILLEETGSSGFVGYLKYAAQQGISIGRVSRGGSETPPLTGAVVWIYWLAELVLTGGAAAYLARAAAQEPYCEQCRQWFPAGAHVGHLAPERSAAALAELRAGNFDGFLASVMPGVSAGEGIDVYLQRCSQPDIHDSLLVVRAHALNSKGQLEAKDLLSSLLPPHMAAGLQRTGQGVQVGAS